MRSEPREIRGDEEILRMQEDPVAARVEAMIAAIPVDAEELARAGVDPTGRLPFLRHLLLAPCAAFARSWLFSGGFRRGAEGFADAVMAGAARFLAAAQRWQDAKAGGGAARRILYLHETAQVAGAERSLLNLVRNLDRRRFTPVFFLPERGPFAGQLEAEGVQVETAEFPPLRSPLRAAAAALALARRIRAGRFDLVHANSPRTNLLGGLAARLARRVAVFHARNLLTTERFDPDRAIAPLARAILCNSAAIRARFAGLPHATVIMNGVDPREFDPAAQDPAAVRAELGIPAGAFVIGMTSRFGPDKGHEEFLAAAERLAATDPSLRFLIVGDAVFAEDRPRETMIRLIAAEKLGARAIFPGYRADMPRMLSAMDLFALPAHREPCGRVLFEAQAMGLPVVGTDSGGTPEIVEAGVTGLLVPPKDPEALASALGRLIADRPLRLRMGRAARARVKALFSIRRNAESTMRVYDLLLSRPLPPRAAPARPRLPPPRA